MIEEQAFIIALSENSAVVEIKSSSSCNSCDAQSSCGTSSLSELFGKRPSQFNLSLDSCDAQNQLKVGDAIMIGLDDLSYLKASLLIYLLPILSMFVFALCAEQLLHLIDLYVLFMGLLGLLFGFKIAGKQASKNKQLLTPQFIKKL